MKLISTLEALRGLDFVIVARGPSKQQGVFAPTVSQLEASSSAFVSEFGSLPAVPEASRHETDQ